MKRKKDRKGKRERTKKNVPDKKSAPKRISHRRREKQKKEKETINQLKLRLQPVIDEANERWAVLDNSGLRSLAISRALEESNSQWGFEISQLTTRESILTEATRARVFLSDKTSTPEGADLYTQQESYKQYAGQFGGKYHNWENKFKNYNINVIDEDTARVAFKAYRALEESEAARIIEYGSENTIIAMYDMAIKMGYNDAEDSSQYTDVSEMMRELLSRELGERARDFERSFARNNEILEIFDEIEMEGLLW